MPHISERWRWFPNYNYHHCFAPFAKTNKACLLWLSPARSVHPRVGFEERNLANVHDDVEHFWKFHGMYNRKVEHSVTFFFFCLFFLQNGFLNLTWAHWQPIKLTYVLDFVLHCLVSTCSGKLNSASPWHFLGLPLLMCVKIDILVTLLLLSHVEDKINHFFIYFTVTWRRFLVTFTSCQLLSLNFPFTGSTKASKAPDPKLMTKETAPFFSARLT